MGHEVVLMPPAYIKPYVKQGKNDVVDTAAIYEAMSRPDMRFVPINPAACREPKRARGNVWGPRLSDFIRASGSRAAQTGRTYGGRRPMRSQRQIACQPGPVHIWRPQTSTQ